MIKNQESYIKMLLSSQISVASLEDALRLVQSSDELLEALNNPNYSADEKQQVINDLFSPSVREFMGALSAECQCADLKDIIGAYIVEIDRQNNIIHAPVCCHTEPDEKQL